MDLLKLRLREGRVQLKTMDEEPRPDTILMTCFDTLTMMKLFRTKEKRGTEQYIMQTSKYARGSFMAYKCWCGKSPCLIGQEQTATRYVGPIAFAYDDVRKDGQYLPSSHNVFKDGENLPSYNWEQIESGSVLYSDLPPLFLIYLKSI